MLQLDWITFLATLLAALIIGAVLSRLWIKSRGEDTEGLKRQLDDLKRQHQNYQISVTEHFNRTTELIESLNQSYSDIRDHLNHGADELVAPEYRLESARVQGEDLHDLIQDSESAATNVDMPRDYAPKDRHQEGTLSETFGLRPEESSDEDETEEEAESTESPSKKTH